MKVRKVIIYVVAVSVLFGSLSGCGGKEDMPEEEAGVMEYDAARTKIVTYDKKHLVINISVRWKIVEPLKFYKTVRNEYGAQTILDDIVFSELREELARHTLTEIVSVNREQIMAKVAEQCNQKAGDYGIQVIDVQIKRADLPQER